MSRALPKSEQEISKPRRKPERIAPRRDDIAYLSDQLDQRRAQEREQEPAFIAAVRAMSPDQLEVFHQRMAKIEASLEEQECTVVPLRGLPGRPDGDDPRPAA